MYLPSQFAAEDQGHACQLMREHPFATLISVDDDGLPFVTPLPLAGLWVLGSYYAAQLLIVLNALRQKSGH